MRRPRTLLAPVLVAGTGMLLGSCSRASDDLADPTPTEAPVVTQRTPAGSADRVTSPVTDPAGTRADLASAGPTSGGDSAAAPVVTTAPATIVVTEPPISVEELPEVGVPGLDSADAFCASWSRFAGSFQVVAVTAAFGSGPPASLASLEVAASPVVTEAYDDLLANWPDELSSERDLVADRFLGPFARRLDVAFDSLMTVDDGPVLVDAIAEAWLAGLANRDPSTPEFTVDLPDDAWDVIDVAAVEFAEQLVPFESDPSLVSDVSVPLTEQYLAVSCPDQGTLSGQEVDSP